MIYMLHTTKLENYSQDVFVREDEEVFVIDMMHKALKPHGGYTIPY